MKRNVRISLLAAGALLLVGSGAWLAAQRQGSVDRQPALSASSAAAPPLAAENEPATQAPAAPQRPANANANANANAETAGRPPDWTQRYFDSADHFALVQDLADASLRGDVRAPYVLSRILLDCKLQELNLRPYPGATLAQRTAAYFAAKPGGVPAGHRAFARRTAQCEKLVAENALAGRGLPDQARDFRYWRELARDAGDPVAVMERALRTDSRRRSTDDHELASQLRDAVLGDVRVAVESGEPQAYLLIGGLLGMSKVAEEREAGLAWAVAGCESGYDCSPANPDLGHACIDAGTCELGLTLPSVMQRDLGAAKYAAIYATSQDILYKARNGDWEGLQQYLLRK